MPRGSVVLVLAVALLVGGAYFLHAKLGSTARSHQPNVLVISLCSVRADHMSCYGYERKTTPYFDILASDSILFENAITQWPKTAPGFAALMTGKYGHTTKVMRITPGRYLEDKHETLAETLAARGYETAAFISTPVLNTKSNMLQGFETIEETWRLPRYESYFATTERAVEWLKKPHQSPFLAWVHYNSAHQPYYPFYVQRDMFIGDEYYDSSELLEVQEKPLPVKDLPPEHPDLQQILRPDIGGIHLTAAVRDGPDDPPRRELGFYIAQYDTCIFSADRLVGWLLREFEKTGLLENTIVAVVGDHGESLGEHNYYFAHGRLPYEECARVPLMIRPPGGCEAIRVSEPVAAFDLAPTILDMVGIDPPEEMEARSLLPIAYGKEPARYVFMESGYALDYVISVWDGDWKLSHLPSPIDRLYAKGTDYELYNLKADPGELNNVYEFEPEVAARLRRILEEWSAPWVADAYSTVGTTSKEVDQETIDKLRALGYLP